MPSTTGRAGWSGCAWTATPEADARARGWCSRPGGGHATLVRAAPARARRDPGVRAAAPSRSPRCRRGSRQQFDPHGHPQSRARWRRAELMQTNFTLAQLADPHVAESEKILRTCVHCGFCTATCPTYVPLGDELDSPRGRIYLIKDMLENDRPADRRDRHAYRPLPVLPVLHDDLPVGRELHAPRRPCPRPYREDLPAAAARPADPRAAGGRAALSRPLPRRTGAGAARQAAGAGCSSRIAALKPFAAMLALAPARLPPRRRRVRPAVHAAAGARRGRVAILTGCAQPVLDPGINEAAIRLLDPARRRGGGAAGRRLLRRAGPPHGPRGSGARRGAAQHRCLDARDRRAAGSTRSSSPRRAAARRSRTTASCCASTRPMRKRPRGSRRWPRTSPNIWPTLDLPAAGSPRPA